MDTDPTTIAAAAADDKAAQTRLVLEFRRRVASVAWRMASCQADAEDLEIEGLTAISTKAAKAYDPARGVQFSTYAMRIATNEMLHELRKQRRRRRGAAMSLDAETADGGTLGDVVSDEREQMTAERREEYERLCDLIDERTGAWRDALLAQLEGGRGDAELVTRAIAEMQRQAETERVQMVLFRKAG